MSSESQKQNLPSGYIRSVPEYLPTELTYQSYQTGESNFSAAAVRDAVRLLLKHRLLIAATTLGFILFGLIYVFTATPIYQAESRVRISSYQPVLAGTSAEDFRYQASQRQDYFETQVEEIKSLSLGDRVLNDPTIKNIVEASEKPGFFTSLFSSSRKNDDAEDAEIVTGEASKYNHDLLTIRSLLDRIYVSPVRRTTLVKIVAGDPSPEAAAKLANAYAQGYIDWVRDTRVKQQSRGVQFLEQQATELRTKVADIEREMADYAEKHSIVALNKDENITMQKVSQLNKLYTEATARRIEATKVYEETLKAENSGEASVGDQAVQEMRARLGTLEAEQSQLSAKYTDEYPRMKQLKAQIVGLKRSIGDHRKELVLGLKAKAAAAKEEEENLKQELEEQKSHAFELSKRQVEYNILNRELTSSRELLQNVMKQKKETSLSVESNASNVDVVDFAAPPLSPSYPRKRLTLMICAFFGMGIGIGLSFLLHYLDNSLHTADETVQLLGLPNLGVVPSFESESTLALPSAGTPANEDGTHSESEAESATGDSTLSSDETGASDVTAANLPDVSNTALATNSVGSMVFYSSPKSLAAEAYRTIRTGILLSQAGEPPRSILVTSAQPSEGKTTLSANLAACLGSTGGKVALIDADLRRPSLWRYFSIDRYQPGMVEVLTGHKSLSEVYVEGLGPNITLIPSGKVPPNPAELLGSQEMSKILAELEQTFDFVILDSAPVLPVTDSVALSRFVDGVLLVIKGGATPKKVVGDAASKLRIVGATVLGTVLNNIDLTRGDYGYYNRYYYSQYYAEDEEQSSDDRKVVGL